MSTAAQAYLHTRVSIMATRLFDPARARDIGQLELGELAEQFGLGQALDAQWSARVRARAIEQVLLNTLLTELAILLRPMNDAERALILSWARKFALANLKSFLRGKLHNIDPDEIRGQLYDLPDRLRLSSQRLFQAENVLELLRLLEQGPFAAIARQAREAYESKREPFALEATIDQRYYAELLRHAARQSGAGATALRRLFGAMLDQVNLLWLLRLRFTYEFSPGETFYQLVPSPRLLHRERLLALANLDSLPRVLAALPPPLEALMAGAGSLLEVQRRAGLYLAGEMRQILSQGRDAVARALAYLILRELDLSLLFARVQGHLLGLPQDLVAAAIDRIAPEPHADSVCIGGTLA